MRDAVVIGAGLAGLAATLRLAEGGATVTLVTKGIGGLQLSQGTIDVLGYSPERVDAPLDALRDHVAARPGHPYEHVSAEDVRSALTWFTDTLGEGWLVGDPERNVVLPTAVGALRPTCLYPPSMAAGVPDGRRILVVGLDRLKDFPPRLVAENLARQAGPDGTPIRARWVKIDLEIRPGEVDTSSVNHARAFDDPDMRARLAEAIRRHLEPDEIVALPAVLGLNDRDAWKDLAHLLGTDVFEIALQPPSVPGMRLNQELTRLAKGAARVIQGAAVVGHEGHDGHLDAVTIASAGHHQRLEAKYFVHAAGGFESGALELDSWGTLTDRVLGLEVSGPGSPFFHADFWGEDQPLFLSGLRVDEEMRPLTAEGNAVQYDNVRAAGGCLAGATRWREKSGEGIALVTALRAADSILGGLR